MVWLPVAFVCVYGGSCGFQSGKLSVSIEQCLNQNDAVTRKFMTDINVANFQLTCIQIQPNKAGIA
jgi:lipid-binding SYLF domain-containing protein